MSLRVHLCSKLTPLLVTALAIIGKKSHCLNRECENCLCTLLVEPLHESLLQPRKAVPVRLSSVWEVEVTEERLEIVLVIVSHIPEYCLEVTSTCWLVDRIYNLLKAVCYYLIYSTLTEREVYDPMDCSRPPGFSGSITNSQSSCPLNW